MSTIQIKDEQGVRIITINRPEKRNALDLEMYTALREYLIQGDADNAINAFLIKGQDDCFTAGNDVADFLKNSDLGPEHPAFKFLFSLLDLKKPLIAAVSGAAVGIGTTLLLHCDLVYADTTAKFQLPFTNLALVPEAGASLLLPHLIGHQKAAELLLLGESFNAQTAKSLHIINDCVDPKLLFDTAFAQAVKIAAKPPLSIQATKALMRPDKALLHAKMTAELTEFATRLQSDEAKAQFKAFLSR
ncbi:enoyl-CoA hydratase-related protein [Shewanella waksmanii]|uniref:enoyl-CoA hydratase-related protein n=1 Tax=Shewanella waksmanii TaxID=213783 RepID=UPI0004920610|nr:enoyl-CoA hydratase-related protein [Shewanella waksmanii]